MRYLRTWLIPFWLMISSSALAAPVIEVEGVQSPAWLVRDGGKQALRFGQTLAASDVVETGAGGRLLLRLPDGAQIRLGSQASLRLNAFEIGESEGGLLRGVFNIARGAFRYTSATVARAFSRDLRFGFATTTIGVRGTDVWGRSDGQAESVCLIEGRIQVENAAAGSFEMDKPLSFFVAPKQGAPAPVAPVDPAKLKQWAAEVELENGRGVMLAPGGWIVQLGSHTDEKTAQRQHRQLNEAGYPAQLTVIELQKKTFYRLRLAGYDSKADAEAVAKRLRGKFGVRESWVTCEIPGRSCR